jgi:hypothetical protein
VTDYGMGRRLDRIAEQIGEGTCPECGERPLVAIMDAGEVYDVGRGTVDTLICQTCGRERALVELHWPE